MAIDPVKLSQDLVRCPSVYPDEAGAHQVMIDVLEPLGFECTLLTYGDITNLFARLGTGEPHFNYTGHNDVVPAGDENSWSHPPFAAEIHDGKLYGRGIADMKGDNACFVAAISAYLEKNGPPKGSVSILITGDEEIGSANGAPKVLEWMAQNGHTPTVSLVGEPSNPKQLGDEMKIGRRGYLDGFLTVTGKQGHSAYPDRADNPLPRLVKILDALANHQFDHGSDFFIPTNLQLTSIDVGNPAHNVIPEKGKASFNVRFNDLWDGPKLEKKIREICDSVTDKYELKVSDKAVSFLTEPGEFTAMVADMVEEVTGRRPAYATGGGSSDARFMQEYCPVIEFGLVNNTIHQVDEHVEVEDLYKLADIYERVLNRYFSKP